jgi:hypothetical protein
MVLSLNCCAPRNKLMFDSKHFFDKTAVVKRDTDWEILE